MSAVPQTIGVLIPSDETFILTPNFLLNKLRESFNGTEIKSIHIEKDRKCFFVFFNVESQDNEKCVNPRASLLVGSDIFGDVLISTCSHQVVTIKEVQKMIEVMIE
jgi:hypothetical protein